ncbi:MAG: hypothetical protein ACI4QL_06270 [Candidatus Fimimonas sp.]
MEKLKKTILIVFAVMLGVLAVATTVTTFAYFSKKEIYDGFFSGEVELLFDRLDDDGVAGYQAALTAEGETVTVDKNASWGSKEYPYVISDVRHLYNLSELQRLGYFYKKYVSQNTETDFSHIPYFLVCKPNYTPVLIDGTNFKGITSIGTDEYPFIGSVKGVQSSTNVVTINGKNCDTSAIYNVKVSGNPVNADVGLFGHVGYLGSSTVDAQTGMFTGQISTLSNLVLMDVQVTVHSDLWTEVTSFLEEHLFSFSSLEGTDDYNKVPHENHHVGILVGHAAYAKIEFISVYYSKDDVVAIDLHDKTVVGSVPANYLSATGIMGFIDNINPTVVNGSDGNLAISAGSGDSLGDLSYGAVGGGGLESGTKAGYVLASDMYQNYQYHREDPDDENSAIVKDESGTIILKNALTADGTPLCTEWIRDRLLWGTEATGRYYFYDGVFTFALSSDDDVIEPTWNGAADEFSIGSEDAANWEVNYSKGNKAVVAYVKKIVSNEELNTAIADGKQIFILNENGEQLFLMSLFNASTAVSGTFEEKYSTNGTGQQFGSQEFVDSLIQSYQGGELELPKDMSGYTTEELIAALQSNDLRAINVGITSSTMPLETLEQQYKITPNTTGQYSYFSGQTPVAVNDDGTLNEYYDYDNSGYDGYFYFTYETRWLGTQYRFTYYWQTATESVSLGNSGWGGSSTPSLFSATAETWAEETVYTDNNGHTGVVVNKTDGIFYDSGNVANANGASLTKASGTSVYYFYKDVDGTSYYHSTDTATAISQESFYDTGTTSISGQKIYSANGKEGVLLDRYPTYTFSSGENYLRMVRAKFNYNGTHYVLWNGTDSAANNANNFTHTFTWISQTPTVSNSTKATLKFNADGTCYIQYGIDSTGLYVNSTGTVFNTATSNTEAGTKLCIYTVEGTQDINYGRVTFDPIDDAGSDTDSFTFSAGTHVLVASPSYQKGTTANIASSSSYTVTSLEDLQWNNGNKNGDPSGSYVSESDLQKKFRMLEGIDFGATITLGNGSLGTGGIISAPVGTNGVEADIPQSCIAFRVNKAAENIKIRVIVSVAVSEYYPGETTADGGYELNDGSGNEYVRFFNLWRMDESGSNVVNVFNATGDNLLENFVVPRSHPYEPGQTAANEANEYVNVSYQGSNYHCYLNGDRVLVAYEFSVNTNPVADGGYGVGVFCLGMSGLRFDEYGNVVNDSNGNPDVVTDVPMEIVYFSAEGVASAGRDGASGSQIGTIDFVYDYGGAIVTVKESSATDEEGNEDYNNYYSSFCLMYFDTNKPAADYTEQNPTFVPVNYEYVKVRRFVVEEGTTPSSDENHNTTASRSTMQASLGGDKNTCIVQYSRNADNVQITETTDSP